MNLAAIQLLSLVTKAITTFLGIAQAFLIVHFLTKAEFGAAGLVISIGSVIGVTQHLGVVDGAIREIAVQKDKREIGKLFWVSHVMRQIVTVPLSIALIFSARFLAERIYGLPEIAPLIQIYAASLVLLGMQDVLGATLTGMKKFIALYVVQIGTAAVNIGIFAYFIWRFTIVGYFWAINLTTAVMVVWYALIIARYLRGHLQWPSWPEIRLLARRVLRISVYMYASRILFVVWQRLPLLVLGMVLAKEQLGELNLSLTFGSKLTILAMALSEVNLSWMSSLFVRNQPEWQRVVTRNMQRLFFVLVLVTAILIFFAPEFLHIPVLLEYLPARHMVIVMTMAFFIYSLIDIGTSSVFVAADQPRWRTIVYALMTAITAGAVAWLMVTRPDPFLATLGVLAGAGAAYAAVVIIAWRRFNVALLTRSLATVLALFLGSMVWLLGSPALPWRLLVFAALLLYLAYEARHNQLVPQFSIFNFQFSNRTDKNSSTHYPPYVFAQGKLPTTHPTSSRRVNYQFICFAGAFYDAPTWTNRQHVMSRFSAQHPVLYVEPRVWLVRYVIDHWREPARIVSFFKRIVWWEQIHPQLYIKAQWNLIPGSREYGWISRINHWMNQWNVRLAARALGFLSPRLIMWIYDTEAAEYLDVFPHARVVYDCVDDHSVQAGPNRNPERVRAEERMILQRAHVVTVTSQRLYEQKKPHNANTHLIEQGADVAAFLNLGSAQSSARAQDHPVIGSVGALDSYKYDFDLIAQVARAHPEWQFVFIGEPMVREKRHALGTTSLADIGRLPNVRLLGSVPREQVPGYVKLFDVCIIPYRANAYNRSSFPLKFWEFMATGKPIVVSGLPELRQYHELIAYTATPEQFAEAVQNAIRAPQAGAAKRTELARHHSWEKRVEQLLALLPNVGHD